MAISRQSASTRGGASRKKAGFSLIELVVVVGVVAILTTILVGYSRQNSRQLLLSSTEAKVLSLVSRAKFLSVETFFQQIGSGAPRRTCAYGVHMDTSANEIFIFQDRAPQAAGCDAATDKYEPGANDARLTSELDVVKIDPEVFTLSGSLRDIVYIPPDPDVIINDSPGTRSATIEIGLVDGSDGFTIRVNDVGQVRAE